MSEFNTEDITDRAGTGKPDLTNGFNINGSDSGISPHKHTESATEPSSPSNGDAWLDTTNNVYKVYINNEWKEWFGTSAIWYGDRDLRTGAQSSAYYDIIHYNSITTLGNAADFGDVTFSRTRQAACSNGTYSYRFGGSNSGTATGLSALYNVVDYFANASLGNASDFGDASSNHSDGSAHSDGTTGVVWKGLSSAIVVTNAIDKYTLDTPGNATDFGDVSSTTNRWAISEAGCGNGTRGIFWGGTNPSSPYTPSSNTIDYVTVASPGNATDFGDMNLARYAGSGTGAGTDDRCLYFGGYASGGVSQIDYITASTTGNAADFGDLNPATNLGYTQYYGGAAANATRALYHFSYTNNQISYVTMSTTGNATDFGDQLITSNAMQSHSSGNAS